MNLDSRAALFVLLGQTATKQVAKHEALVPADRLLLAPTYDLATLLPETVRRSIEAAEVYRLFFVFENFLREFVVDTLSSDPSKNWWDRLPQNVVDEVSKLEKTEESKSWMALGSRDKSALLTYPQLIAIIEAAWKEEFEPLVRDRTLINEARAISHLRNTICHMTEIPAEEADRVRQTMRDWFRVVSP